MNNQLLQLKNLSSYLFGWSVVFIIHFIFLVFNFDLSWSFSLLESFVTNSVYMLVGLTLWYSVRYIKIEKHSPAVIFTKTTFGSFLTSLVAVGFVNFIFQNILQSDKWIIDFLNRAFYWQLIIGCLYYDVIAAVIYLLVFNQKLRVKIAQEAELQTLIKEAELKSLKYQLNPHFIFNSLNSVSSLTITNPDKAREMIIKLSSFLRSTLSENEKQMNELRKELENVRLYLEIEKIRFGDKFELLIDFDEKCLNVKVPNMIFQPLFENAIKYGVYESLEKVYIKVKCFIENEYLRFTVENNFDSEVSTKKGKGIGLNNIKNRLSLIYNQNNLLAVEKKKNLFSVSVFIPLEER